MPTTWGLLLCWCVGRLDSVCEVGSRDGSPPLAGCCFAVLLRLPSSIATQRQPLHNGWCRSMVQSPVLVLVINLQLCSVVSYHHSSAVMQCCRLCERGAMYRRDTSQKARKQSTCLRPSYVECCHVLLNGGFCTIVTWLSLHATSRNVTCSA